MSLLSLFEPKIKIQHKLKFTTYRLQH